MTPGAAARPHGLLQRISDGLSGLLVRFYPVDFREEMGQDMREAYHDRFGDALRRRGRLGLVVAWFAAIGESARNAVGERARPSIKWRRSGQWGADAERVVKRLVRAPLFALSVVATIAVGLAAFSVVYTAVFNVVLKPLPYDRPEGLYVVWRNYEWIKLDRGWTAGTDIIELSKLSQVERVAAVRPPQGLTLTMPNDASARPREVRLMPVSPELFPMLGVRPALGRVFRADETGPGKASQVVLSHEMWRTLGGDSALVGGSIQLEGKPATVIGVMPPNFRFVRQTGDRVPERADMYATLPMDLAKMSPMAGAFGAVVRKRDNVSEEAFLAAIASLGASIDREHMKGRGLKLYAVNAREDLVSAVRPALIVMACAAALLVVVLTANLASLLLVRATEREREFAISRALGADGSALARATVLEGAVLGMMGGAVAAAIALWGSRTLMTLTPADFPRREALALDANGALVAIATGLALGVIAGIIPAVWAIRLPLGRLLALANTRAGARRATFRRVMLVAQIAMSFILLCSGALVVRTLDGLLRANPGFNAQDVVTLRIPITQQRVPTNAEANVLHQRVEDVLRAIPGVERVGGGSSLPMTAQSDQRNVSMPGAPGNTGEEAHDSPLSDIFTARAGYVETLGIRVVEGAAFQQPYRAGAREVMIDETLARTFYPAGGAVGRRINIGKDSAQVVAVIGHARQYDVNADGRPQVYARDEDGTYGPLSWTLRTSIDAASLTPSINAAIREVDPTLAVANIRSMSAIVEDALRPRRLTATLVGGFALTALLLTAVGLFGTVASAVLRRRHEMAIRLALGAHHGKVLRLLLGESARQIALGLVIAVPGFLAAGAVLDRVLVGVSRSDPLTIAGVAIALAAIAMLASYLPARRVMGIQPAKALKED